MLRQLRAVTLQWYVVREFLLLFVLTLLSTTVLLLLMLSFLKVVELEAFGATLGQVLLLSPFLLPQALVQAMPPSTMIAAIMVFGRMSAENEILAAQAGGAPLRIMGIPLVFCAVAVSASSLLLQDHGVRWGNTMIRDEVLKINRPEFFQNIDKPNQSISIQSDQTTSVRINMLPYKVVGGKTLKPIQIVYFKDGKQGQTVFAEDHEFTSNAGEHLLIVRLRDVQIYGDRTSYSDEIDWGVTLPDIGALIPIGNTRGQKSYVENRDLAERIAREEHLRWEFTLRRASDFGAMASSGSTLDPAATALSANSWNDVRLHVEQNGGALERMKLETIEYHRKFALSLLPIAMVLLGMGLGLLVKKSNRMVGFLTGVVLYCMLYFPLTIVAKSLSSSSSFAGYNWLPQHAPGLLFMLIGVSLLVGHESGRLNGLPVFLRPGTYINFDRVGAAFVWVWGMILKVISLPVKLFARTTDRYIAATFLAPLVVIIFSIAGFLVALDAIEHHNDIADGVAACQDPIGNLPKRTRGEAIQDVVVYYAIQGVEITLDFLPLEILLAGMLCAMVLVRNQEHLILKSSGVPLQRALLPVLFLALLACVSVSVVREFCMPALVMRKDNLKPLVYHRVPQLSAFALYTYDEKKKPLLFVVSQYEAATKSGRDMRVYLLGDQKNKRIPTISSDVIKWDGKAWELWTDPAVQEQAAIAAKSSFGGPPKDVKKKPDEVPTADSELKRGGVLSVTESLVVPGEAASREADAQLMRAVTIRKSQMNTWPGIVDPKYIDGERLGARVMRLSELESLSEFKPVLKVDWFRRVSEFLMGLLLLCCALPLMFNDDTGSPVKAIVFSLLFGAVYMGLNEFAASMARGNTLPQWAPLLPHALFFLIGMVQYVRRLQT